jgi:hypothetical protein
MGSSFRHFDPIKEAEGFAKEKWSEGKFSSPALA